ncbi:DUF4340 domain-containing protein [bacterium]|nr:DUF4340 domain-containing protein [bacterium]
MQESQRTLAFVGIATASLVVALFAAPSAPKPPATFDQVGEEFFPNFTDPAEAKTLQVIAYDSEKAESRLFGVEFKDGLWRIPSRHNYPADGKDRLAKCAASIMGLKRESLAGQRPAEHPEFEVVDPLDESSESLKRGQRITLKDANGDALADYIIGKQVPNRAGYYYIRRADENATYIAKIQLDLSTKFADWIEPDLLKVDSFKLVGIEIDNYSIDYEKEAIVSRDRSFLSRKNGSDPWKLEGLDEAKEELNQDEIRKLVDGLDNMKIVGVRPKPPSLSRDLKLGEGLQLDPLVRSDLGQKGFMFARTQGGGMQLVSKEGEVVAKTDQGVVYALYFGEVFSGTEEEIEFGFAKDSAEGEKKDETPDAEPAADGKQKSRYLFVTVQFDDKLIPGKPTEPLMPEEPKAPADVPAASTEGPADALISENAGPQAEYARQKAMYETAVAGYDSAKAKYEAELKAFEEKVTDGEEQVKELNARFADWFYVISAGSFENLRQGRETLVKPKAEPAAETPAAPVE